VDMPTGVARNLVIPRLPLFLQQYPGIELELSSSDRLVDVVREGFDCVVRVGTLKDSGLIARPLGRLSVVNCASPDYLSRFGYPDGLDDLASHAVVHYATHLGTRPQGFEYYDGESTHWVKTGGVLTVNSTETYHASAIAGLGIIQVPRVGVRDALRAKKLLEILPQYRARPMPVSLIYPHRRNLSRRVHLFMAWLTDIMKAYVD
ncbi:MAG TPA: LysR family transcriptional regulator, partial [Leclercia adecarboxylata]|nr:LysR family transcriptional regulator [Leclercia adecarboxylata]